MRTLRLSLAAMVIVALQAGVGGAAVAQDEDPWFGDWLEPTEEGVFSAPGHDLPWCTLDKSEREAEYGPGAHAKEIRNLLFTCEVLFSDSRLSGTQTTRFSERGFTDGGFVNWGTMDIVGADGTWSGWFQGIEDPTGQTNIRHASGGFWDALTQSGVIYSGDPPPVPVE